MLVGLTGGIGAGKSTVANLFKNHGVPIISSDEISHQIINDNKTVQQAIIKKFGKRCLTPDHTIDKRALAKIIFSDQQNRLWLEKLLHPLIEHEFIMRANNSTYPYCIVEIPLLIEAKMQNKVDRILTVDCTEEQQLKQALARGHHSESEVKTRIANQISRTQRLAASDDVIENIYDLAYLQTRVNELHNFYLSLAADKNR